MANSFPRFPRAVSFPCLKILRVSSMPTDTSTTASLPGTLADFTDPRLIIPELRGKDVPAVIQELTETLRREDRVPDFASFSQSVLKRELLVSTATEAGMAFPHARLAD